MKKTKEHPSYKRGIFEAQLFDMKQRRIKKEIELINIAGGIIDIKVIKLK